jgi:hypothetical protein
MPDLFMVSDNVWKLVCGGTYDVKDVLCKECMIFISDMRSKSDKKER